MRPVKCSRKLWMVSFVAAAALAACVWGCSDLQGPPPAAGPPPATAPPGPACPADMVGVPVVNVCIDRYEASRGPDGRAQSVQGAEPWANLKWADAKAACEAAGKRLCRADEWITACQAGPEKRQYPYGNDYQDSACNTGDHKRWHEKHNCSVDDDGSGPNSLARTWHAVPTGSLASCEGGLPGLFDMSGNVGEWADACEGDYCRSRSSGYWGYAAGATQRCEGGHKLHKDATFPYVGFRCCRAP